MTSFSTDVAKAKLLQLQRKLHSTPEHIDQCLDACESDSELFFIIFSLLHELKVKLPEIEGFYQQLIRDITSLNFNKQNWGSILLLINESLDRKDKSWGPMLMKAQLLLTTHAFPEIPTLRSQDARRMFETLVAAYEVDNEDNRKQLRDFYARSFPKDCIIPSVEQMENFICNIIPNAPSQYAWDYYHVRWGTAFQEGNLSHKKWYRARSEKKVEDRPQVRSFGTLKSTTPQPAFLLDKEIKFTGIQSQADKNMADYTTRPENNWVRAHSQNPFVASYSGHAVWFVGLLIDHGSQIKNPKERNQFVKMMMRNFIATYIPVILGNAKFSAFENCH